MKETHSLNEILDSISSLAKTQKRVSIDDILHSLGQRSYGPFFVIPALVELSPIGSIPGIPTVLASIIVLFGVQIAWGRSHIWLPSFLLRQNISSQRMQKALKVMRSIAHVLDKLAHGRFKKLTEGVFSRIIAGLCVAMSLPVPFLEFIPFATSLSMAIILLFGISLLLKDGLLVLLTYVLTGMAIITIVTLSGMV